jgi:phosphocarrier protein HPr
MNQHALRRTVTVKNPQGLHARPADMFVKLANQYEAKIELLKGSVRVDGKSILGILTLAAGPGTALEIEASGSDAQQALEALAELIASEFTEDDAAHKTPHKPSS